MERNETPFCHRQSTPQPRFPGVCGSSLRQNERIMSPKTGTPAAATEWNQWPSNELADVAGRGPPTKCEKPRAPDANVVRSPHRRRQNREGADGVKLGVRFGSALPEGQGAGRGGPAILIVATPTIRDVAKNNCGMSFDTLLGWGGRQSRGSIESRGSRVKSQEPDQQALVVSRWLIESSDLWPLSYWPFFAPYLPNAV
jgi:hypothetical protein